MIIDHTHPAYIRKWRNMTGGRYNGAYYYSQEIRKNIIPNVETDRNWVLVNVGKAADHSIVFIHNNLHPENYDYLKKYEDLVLVCGVRSTCDKVAHLGHAIYLPLSVDVAEIEKHKKPKTKETAYVGRKGKKRYDFIHLPEGTPCLEGLPRNELLSKMAEYKNIYAVGRTAIEGKILGCKVLVYDDRYPSTRIWRIIDNKDAAAMLQQKLDKIDGITRE